MTPVIPYSASQVILIPGTTFLSRKNNQITRCHLLGNSSRRELVSPRLLLPLLPSAVIFPKHGRWSPIQHGSRGCILAATGTEVAIEESASVDGEDDNGKSEVPSDSAEASEAAPSTSDNRVATQTTQSKRSRPIRKSEMPSVKNEELVVGATFTGKVRSIQPFGAFVDFGAFTDGLVHVSQLSDSFVKDVGSFVSIGQEVKVKLLEVNTESGRISLTMREGDGNSKVQQQKESPARTSGDKKRNTTRSNQKRNEFQKTSKFVKGQVLEGTVKNLNRAGAFISLPEGEEGFLPTSEETDDGLGSLMGGTSMQVGQEVSVRVLRITRGQVTLTMKSDNADEPGASTVHGVVHEATNPFVLAFRKNQDIANFLDERENVQKQAAALVLTKESEETKEKLDQSEIVSDAQEQSTNEQDEQLAVVDEVVEGDTVSEEIKEDVETVDTMVDISKSSTDESQSSNGSVKEDDEDATQSQPDDIVEKSDEPVPSAEQNENEKIGAVLAESAVRDEAASDVVKNEEPEQMQLYETPSVGSNEEQKVEPAQGQPGDVVKSDVSVPSVEQNEIEKVELVLAEKTFSEEVANNVVVNDEEPEQVPETPLVASKEEEEFKSVPIETVVNEEIVESKSDSKVEKDEKPEQQNEISSVAQSEKTVEFVPTQNAGITNSSEQANDSSPKKTETKATISPALVKQLREETGAGMMDCKKALAETGGDITKAQEFLRKKGLASADKKASRATAEGRIGSYIHDSRIGVLVEVNCETDFVSRGDIFKELVDDLAMQVAACPQVEYLVSDDVPEEIVNKEKEIEMQKEDLLSKPEQIRSKIVEGRIRKRLEDLTLLEQPYIKNDKVVVKDWVKQTIATIGENIKVKRFVRYNLGEGLEKKSQDFASEVAAQTVAKSSPAPPPPTNQPVAEEAKNEAPKAVISAALVKQLREETGAGMMDCKKALAETGGNLEKAQEYLRKKGLSSAEKKSSRLAAEGRIGSYVHDLRIGTLIEVNCETDFVGRSEKFKELVDDLAMQVVACPQVQYISIEDIPESIRAKEKELEMQREDLLSKPENIREKIVEGRVSKRLGELALIEQPFIKNDNILVKDLVKQTVAALGENIKVRRFVRFTLGEEADKE
ncbi:hypothetical protein Sjap_020020 [Stephania japonica]|uniref:Elongation factor Ts, mitochondrial n=1 Tax=Stephania japonica TaxID=461633 RepID=A0AAP0HZX0_9MAGN